MTVGINMVKIHDCAGGKTDTGADGLCTVTALIFSAGISSGLAAGAGSDAAQLFAVCTMGAAGGFLFGGAVLRSFIWASQVRWHLGVL